jgi:hypothetical protein
MIGVRTMGIETRFASTFTEDPELSVDPTDDDDEVRDTAPPDEIDASWDETVEAEETFGAADFDHAQDPELEPEPEPEPEPEVGLGPHDAP